MIRYAVAAVLAVVLTPNLAVSQDKPIKQSDLPAAVARTVTAETRGATLRGLSKEIEKGKTLYEAEFTKDGHNRDVLIDAAGAVVEIEEQVEMGSLPAPVQAGLKAAAGKGQIIKIESLTKKGALVAYEAQVKTGTKRSEVQVGPDGKRLAHSE